MIRTFEVRYVARYYIPSYLFWSVLRYSIPRIMLFFIITWRSHDTNEAHTHSFSPPVSWIYTLALHARRFILPLAQLVRAWCLYDYISKMRLYFRNIAVGKLTLRCNAKVGGSRPPWRNMNAFLIGFVWGRQFFEQPVYLLSEANTLSIKSNTSQASYLVSAWAREIVVRARYPIREPSPNTIDTFVPTFEGTYEGILIFIRVWHF